MLWSRCGLEKIPDMKQNKREISLLAWKALSQNSGPAQGRTNVEQEVLSPLLPRVQVQLKGSCEIKAADWMRHAYCVGKSKAIPSPLCRVGGETVYT